jgi:2-methylcitrate dehydratase PrpD
MQERLGVRDAVAANGVLVHGLDYDDTHPEGVIHSTASCFPAALGAAAHAGASGRDLVTAFIIGTEVSARLGMVAKGAFHEAGFHPAGTLSPFACALIAGKLYGLSVDQMVMAQGIAISTGSSSSRQFNREGAGTKRLHPGWGAAAGLTAAALARSGFTGPRAVYEGDYGLYPIHLGALFAQCDLAVAYAGLGTEWETLKVAFKPIPACLHLHAVIDAATALAKAHAFGPEDIASVQALVPRQAVQVVCEPIERRRRPANTYSAQTSLPYAVATALVRGRFSLLDVEPEALGDARVHAVADKVQYAIDPNSGYPKYFSGEVIVRLKNGQEFAHREHVNRGCPDRPLTDEEIERKFRENAELVVSPARAAAIAEAVLAIDRPVGLAAFEQLLAAPAA